MCRGAGLEFIAATGEEDVQDRIGLLADRPNVRKAMAGAPDPGWAVTENWLPPGVRSA